MIEEADYFFDECETLGAILDPLDPAEFSLVTQFKNWTIEDVLTHLHMWNLAAEYTLESRERFMEFFAPIGKAMMGGASFLDVQRDWQSSDECGLNGRALFHAWRATCEEISGKYRSADPDIRLAWAGPDMTARSKIIARQMEVWAHGQEVFDRLGIHRNDKDRIRNIAHLGVTTYSWTFRNRGEEPPSPKPYVRLTSPSGAIWQWNEPQASNKVEGAATEFCQVVTQTRNIADTNLLVVGGAATNWMAKAQCFAGAPETPPAKGSRHPVT